MNDDRRRLLTLTGSTLLGSAAIPLQGSPMPAASKNNWKTALTLNAKREPISGSAGDLAAAIRRGADLRIYTEFRHNEHIDTKSDNTELIQEVADFRVTYLMDDRWSAGIMSLRQPVDLPDGFGPRPSMSFFLYNQNGQQAIARPHLDGVASTGLPGPSPVADHSEMPKYHQHDSWDAATNAPSSNFIYDFETYRFCISHDWEEVLSHTADGEVVSGSVDSLADQFALGREFKVAIRGLCADLADDPAATPGREVAHEVFAHIGPGYYYTERKLFIAETHPLVRVRPAIPLAYGSRGWDFGWLIPRTDGFVARWLVDPYTLKFHKSEGRYGIRWFVR